MSKLILPSDGRCRCDRIRIRISAAPLLTMACHCKGCQRMTASAYSLSAAIPSAGFAVIKGETVLGGLQGETHHHYCGHCKSWLFTRMDDMDWFVNLRVSMLDDTSWFAPFIETMTSEKMPWATTPAQHRFEQFPALEDYEKLSAEFAAGQRRA